MKKIRSFFFTAILIIIFTMVILFFSSCAGIVVVQEPAQQNDHYCRQWIQQIYSDLGNSNADIMELKKKNRELANSILLMKIQLEQLQK